MREAQVFTVAGIDHCAPSVMGERIPFGYRPVRYRWTFNPRTITGERTVYLRRPDLAETLFAHWMRNGLGDWKYERICSL